MAAAVASSTPRMLRAAFKLKPEAELLFCNLSAGVKVFLAPASKSSAAASEQSSCHSALVEATWARRRVARCTNHVVIQEEHVGALAAILKSHPKNAAYPTSGS
jgi:hypothetical protein